jgi:2-C-methyl-D-erythritol 4-phosphate cytidylyltransferase
MAKTSVVIVAAGEGKRFGAPKHLALLSGKAILEWTLQAFQSHPKIHEIVLVLNNSAEGREYQLHMPKIATVIPGGAQRQDSVAAGVKALTGESSDIVLVHDGVRPLVSHDLIGRIIKQVQVSGAAAPVIPVEDTLKRVQEDQVIETPDRSCYFRCQTPQGFHSELLMRALDKAGKDGFYGTDEAMLVERLGIPVAAIPGEARNLKITTPLDLRIAEVLLEN